jgi:hypothetical protein
MLGRPEISKGDTKNINPDTMHMPLIISNLKQYPSLVIHHCNSVILKNLILEN